jgi:hypothetical protein
MVSKTVIIVLIVVLLCCSCTFYYIRKSKPIVTPPPIVVPPPPPPPPPPSQPLIETAPAPPPPPPATAAPTQAPTNLMVYQNNFLPPQIPAHYDGDEATYMLIPGANFPGVVGQQKDDATTYIISTFPRLQVRALPYNTPIQYEVRRDRVTLLYDPYTNRVISARVG